MICLVQLKNEGIVFMKQTTKRLLSIGLAFALMMAQVPHFPSQATEQEDILARLPYTGEISKINLSADQAFAMAEAIEAYYHSGSFGAWVALFDAGTGVPGMWVLDSKSYQSDHGVVHEKTYLEYSGSWFYSFTGQDHIFFWNNHQKSLEKTEKPGGSEFNTLYVGENGTKLECSNMGGEGSDCVTTYNLNGGDIDPVPSYQVYVAENGFGNLEQAKETVSNSVNYLLERYQIPPVTINWDKMNFDQFDGSDMYFVSGYIKDGVTLDLEDYDTANQGKDPTKELHVNFEQMATGNWADGREVAENLRQYADLTQFRFNFPECSEDSAITSLFSHLNLPGTLVECYQIVENFYYVIMEENGTEAGYIVAGVKKNGQVTYEIQSQSKEIQPETRISALGNRYLLDSNITLDFAEIQNFSTVANYVDYFRTALENIGGITLNDQGKSDLTQYMQDSIGNFATFLVNAQGKTPEIQAKQVSPLVTKSQELLTAFESLLQESGEELNKELEQAVRVVLSGLDETNWTVYLDSDLINQLNGNNLQVFLDNGQQGFEVESEALNQLLTETNGIFINIQQSGADQYSLTFADSEGEEIQKLSVPIKVFLPTSNEFATVMLEYAQGTENWGGQFNSVTKTIQFSTIFPGTYLIVDNSVEIFDVDDSVLGMIRFMVSKGFFEVDEAGKFHPDAVMSRNRFTKTIVSMFFALDHDQTSSFADVSPDSEFYPYIASGEARDIVAGYDDGLFHGATIITEEMVFALIAQTLVDRKGYFYPDDLDYYLNFNDGANSASQWAQKGVALSARDGILLAGETIQPTQNITRQDAAVYLYRLFMLLEEKQQISFDLAQEVEIPAEETSNSMGLVLTGGGVALVVAGLLLSRKNKGKSQGN